MITYHYHYHETYQYFSIACYHEKINEVIVKEHTIVNFVIFCFTTECPNVVLPDGSLDVRGAISPHQIIWVFGNDLTI